MAKLVCLLVLAFAACMVAGLPQQDVNTMLHRTVRAADPQPQFYSNYHGHGYGGYGHGGYGHGHGGYDHGNHPHVHLVPHCTLREGCHHDVLSHY